MWCGSEAIGRERRQRRSFGRTDLLIARSPLRVSATAFGRRIVGRTGEGLLIPCYVSNDHRYRGGGACFECGHRLRCVCGQFVREDGLESHEKACYWIALHVTDSFMEFCGCGDHILDHHHDVSCGIRARGACSVCFCPEFDNGE